MDNHIELLRKYRVSDAQLDAAERVEDLNKHQVYYRLPSQTRAGHEHIVQFNQLHHRLECTCEAGVSGQTCWAMRAALAHSEIIRQERINEQEKAMHELITEMSNEARAAMPYTIVEDETSSSLDGQRWEMRDGHNIPMR